MHIHFNKRFEEAANTIKIHVLESGFAELDRQWRKQDVCSPYSRLYYVISGKGYLRMPGDCGKEEQPRIPGNGGVTSVIHELRPGYLYLIPRGLSYDYYCEDRLEKVYFHINILLQNGLELFSGCQDYYELPIGERLPEQMKQWLLSDLPENYFHLQGEIYRAAAAFMKEADVAGKVNRRYSEMVTDLFALIPSVKLSVTVQEMAEMLNVSESTLAKHFKKETGMSIGSYRERLLMNRARQLLAMGKMSVGEIAEELGFGDQFYFCKYFKQRQGITPSKYKGYYI